MMNGRRYFRVVFILTGGVAAWYLVDRANAMQFICTQVQR